MVVKFVRVRDAAQFMGVSKGWLDKKRGEGGGPKFSRVGRSIVYSLDDLEKWVAERSVSSTSQADQLRCGR